MDIEAFAARNANISDDEISRDIADTEAELRTFELKRDLVERNIREREAFIAELRQLQEYRRAQVPERKAITDGGE